MEPKPQPETSGDLARYRRLLGYARPYRWRLMAAALALALVSLVEPLITLSFAQIVDRGFAATTSPGAAQTVGTSTPASGAAMSGGLSQSFLAPVTALLSAIPILGFPLLLVAVFALRGAANFAGDTGLHWVASRVVYDIRRDTFAHLLRLPAAWFDRHPPAELTSRITYDAQQVGQATSQALTALVQDSLKLIAALVLMAAVSWRLMLVVFVVAPLVAIVVRSITRRLRAASEAMQTQMGELARFTDEGLRNQRTVKVFSAFTALGERFAMRANAVRQSYMKQERANALATPLIHLSVSFAIAGIVALAILEGQRGRMTAGEFFVFFTALLSVLPPLKALSSVNAVLQRGLAAAGSLFAIADTRAEPSPTVPSGERPPAGAEGAIRFERVSFAYPTREDAALVEVSFSIAPGERVAFVGASGSGKSSVIALIAGFYPPQSGRVDVGGVVASDATTVAMRRAVTLVSQDVLLLNDTVAANIAFGAEAVDMDRVRWAAEAAAAAEFIAALPEGYETRVGEGGSLLSGGQRQRIAIARALYRPAPILLFDEATSALDSASEAAVVEALKRLPAQRTLVHVAHRLSTVRDADRIYVMHEGRLVEAGTHDELLALGGVYARLSALQGG